jgi:Trypsin-like peptidase domain
MLSPDTQRLVTDATVALSNERRRSQGVLIGGHLIATAAHCLNWSGTGMMVLGERFIENVRTKHGHHLKASPVAVDPVSDVAVLGCLDEQEFPEEAKQFEQFCEATTPLSLGQRDYGLFQKTPVYVLSHNKGWVTGQAMQCRSTAHQLAVEMDDSIEGGTSGGPIVDHSGTLLGIVSVFQAVPAGFTCTGMMPRPHLTLPVWVIRKALGTGSE